MPKNTRKLDEVKGGVGCTEARCSKRYKHLSSWGRHLVADHGLTKAQSLAMVVAMRRDVLGPHEEEVNQALLCENVSSCRYPTPVSCPRCDDGKPWPRKSHLAKHLLDMHGMTDENAKLVAADPTLDGAGSSQSVAVSDMDVASEDAEMNHSAEEPTELTYVHKTGVTCLLCPNRVRARSLRKTHLHLMNVHGKSESEANESIARLKSVPGPVAVPGIDSGNLNVSPKSPTVPDMDFFVIDMDEADIEVFEEPNDIAAVSGPKKKRASHGSEAMPTVPCPECAVELKTRFAVKRHMKLKHELSKEAIDQYQIATTTRRCEYCGKDLKNVYAHKCRKKPEEVLPQKAVERCEPGGKRFHPGFVKFLKSQVSANTTRQYAGKARDVGKFWENTINFFLMDQLMEPLHHNVIFPSLTSYLNDSETVGDGNVAIKTYKYLVDYSIEVFNNRYTADPKFDMNAKNDWKRNTKSNKDDYDRRHKNLINAAKQQTAENAAVAKQKGVLEFNPVRLAAVTIHILEHELVRVMLNDLANYKEEEELKNKYYESELRYCLMGQLVASTGKRSDAIANMKVGALQRGKRTANGCWVVTVKEHKTFVDYGPSLVTFGTELLYQAAMAYMYVYRDPSMEDDYLFANLNKKPTQMRQSVQWMKDKLIKGFCNEEELKSLSAKAFRKAFSNWGRDHPDLEVRENVCEVQDHSQNVQQTNYAIASCEKASFVTKSIIDFIKSEAYRNGSTELPGG